MAICPASVPQIALVEIEQQGALASMRQEWSAELAALREDVAARRSLLAAQVGCQGLVGVSQGLRLGLRCLHVQPYNPQNGNPRFF